MPDEETSDDPEPEPGGPPPPAEGTSAEAPAESSEPAPEAPQEEPPAADQEPPGGEAPLSGETLIVEVLRRDSNAARVLAEEFDLPCYRCPARHVETLAGGITYKGYEAEQILSRLRELRGEPLCAPEVGA